MSRRNRLYTRRNKNHLTHTLQQTRATAGVQLAYEYRREHALDEDTGAHPLPRAWVWEAQGPPKTTRENERKAIISKYVNSILHRLLLSMRSGPVGNTARREANPPVLPWPTV